MVDAIRGYGMGPRGPARTGRARGGFHLPESPGGHQAAPGVAPGATSEAAGVAAASPPGLGGLQAALAPRERDAAAARRGQALLSELGGLQAGLLAGRVPDSALRRLAQLTEGEAGADPALRELLEGISLRARVELARLGR